ncbi:MAG: glycosyltransferase family 4 protein [Vicinamibacteraceae bacterium]
MSHGISRVVYAWNYLEWGGAQVHAFALMREAMTHVPVSALLPHGSDPALLAALDRLGVPCQLAFPAADTRPAPTVGRKLARHAAKIRSERAMVAALRRLAGPGVVFHVDLAPWQSALALVALARRSHVFLTCHNALPVGAWWRERLWRAKFAALSRLPTFHLFASNVDARRSLARFLGAAAVERVAVTYTGIDPQDIDAVRGEPIDAVGLRARYALPARPLLVACVGQFIDRKGRWTFLDAARRLAAARGDVGFLWISNSEPGRGDRARADTFGLGEAFRLLTAADVGPDRRDLFRLVRLADIFCLPTHVDGLPLALLEAMALGVPAISTPVFAIPEAIVDGETGRLVEPGDPEALAGALGSLLDDCTLRQRLGARGRAHVVASFDERASARIAWAAYAAAVEA